MRLLRDNRGVTFVEVMAATVIVGFLAAALQNATHFILGTEEEASSAWIVHELGISLLEEVAATAFDDPQTGSTALGADAGEWPDPEGAPSNSRALFDDVDDYVQWDGTYPLQHKNGTKMGITGYTRKVEVGYVTSTNYAVSSVGASAHKLITVKVYEESTVVGEFSTVRVQGGRRVDLAS